MKLLEDRILSDGKVLPGGILKVDNFLNHQIDTALLWEMAQEFHRLFGGEGVNKILTIEASGIAIAAVTGCVFGCPMVFAKKSKTKNLSDRVWAAEVESFTHGNKNTVLVSKDYLHPGDRVLIVDDFADRGRLSRHRRGADRPEVPLRAGGRDGRRRGHRDREALPGRRRRAESRRDEGRIPGPDRRNGRRFPALRLSAGREFSSNLLSILKPFSHKAFRFFGRTGGFVRTVQIRLLASVQLCRKTQLTFVGLTDMLVA